MATVLAANLYGVAVKELEISALTHADVHLAQTNPVKDPNMPVQVGVRMVIVAILVRMTSAVAATTAITMMMPTSMTTTMMLTTLMTMMRICQMMSPSAIPACIQDQRVQKLMKLRIVAMRTDHYK